MSRFVALVSGLGWHVQDLLRAAERMDLRLDPLPFPSLVGFAGLVGRSVESQGRSLDDARGVLVRMMPPGTLEQVVYRMDALHRLAGSGIPVLNPPRAVEASVDKYLSTCLIERAGLPVPPTATAESSTDALRAYDELGPDVVVKPLFGAEGRGIVRVQDRELARRAFQTLERLGALIYLQKTIRHPGHDVRVFVLGGRVLGAIRRHAAPGEWRTNVALGGRAEARRDELGMERLALQAAEAVGAVMAGVDLIEDLDGGRLLVLEVNAVPGWRALAAATGVDVAAAILDELRERSS
ncbi:MAG: RimK family alpha-L-glutamate ligase [Isosphaeraceae bacterium]